MINISIKLRKTLSKNRDYLFKLRILLIELDINNNIIAYIVNSNINIIQITNIFSAIVSISRKIKLNKVIKYKKEEYFFAILLKISLAIYLL